MPGRPNPEKPKFRFEPLDTAKHNRAAFSCEQERLTSYLKEQASQEIKKRVAAVYVLIPDGKTIAGYYTLSQFSIDAGVMPADTGHGAAGFTNVITKSGGNFVHGSLFEFVRNADFDARNFFDHKNDVDTRRLPPFVRNEFGLTNGGPVVLPRIYDGRGKTFYFAEYQGFRQVLGTTQVMPVPTQAERQGIDTTTFPGDTLTVPVNSSIALNFIRSAKAPEIRAGVMMANIS